MGRYRKKPVEVETYKYGIDRIPNDCMIADMEVYDRLHDTWVNFEEGDYIIRGIKDEWYPCKSDVFEETYEKVE